MGDDSTYSIGELAAAAEVTPRTIRYYTAEGLLPAPEVRGKYAVYSQEHLERLRLIAQLKAAYLPLGVIKERLAALDAAQVRQALAQPLPPAEVSDSAAEYIASALAQRRAAAPPLPRVQPDAELDAAAEQEDLAKDEDLAEVTQLEAGAPAADQAAEGAQETAGTEEAEQTRAPGLREQAARYDAGLAQERPASELDRKRAAPVAPPAPAPQAPAAPGQQAPPSAVPPAPAAPSLQIPPASGVAARSIAPGGAPPAPAAEQPGPPPAPETPRARGGLLGRLLPQRQRAPPAPEPAGAPEPERWSRVTLAPGVELHIREPAAPGLRERIARLIAEARSILAD